MSDFRRKKRICVEFLGRSASEVVQSCYKITNGQYTILLDYGLYQCQDPMQAYRVNHERYKELNCKEIDYIFLSHANVDHCGALPWLYRYGCAARCFVPAGNRELMRIMFLDSAKIMRSDAEKLSTKYGMKAFPLYDDNDVEYCMRFIEEMGIGTEYSLHDDLRFRFTSAHHIINSAQIEQMIGSNGEMKRIHYTGDIGSPVIPKPYVQDFAPIDEYCNLLIGECTYAGDKRNHSAKDRAKDKEKIDSIIRNVCGEHGGKVLFPVFSLDRLQTILTALYEVYGGDDSFTTPVVIDTPMGIQITHLWDKILTKDRELWESVIGWKNIRYAESWEQSVSYQEASGPMIILASSGMCTSGRSVSWVKRLLPGEKNHICFCGYAAEDSLAYMIKNAGAEKRLIVDGESVRNNAGITSLFSFSSHACRKELMDLYTKARYGTLCLVHSDEKGKLEFASELKEKLAADCRSSKVVATTAGYHLYI